VSSAGPRVIAVLVTHDGAPRLRRTLTAVGAQTHGAIEVIAVDNASEDGTGALLVELLGPDRVVLSDRDVGVPVGIDLALDAFDAHEAALGRNEPLPDDLVLLLHDDLELGPDAVARLVAALEADGRVAIVGPKLRWSDDPDRLQSVGATIDLTGRVDDGIDPDELDQGQRDGDRRVLFVPTAGMLVRRHVFDALGRFDPRAHAFREDLDLCWRAALAGHDVEVVPAAVGLHAGLAAEHLRPGRVAQLGPRYLAERNTLAALLRNYGPGRLALVLPLALLVGVAKVAGFLLTRRISDARETVAAWAWNVANLRGTLRQRRRVQRMRRRSDAELAPLFGRITPRLWAYVEAVLERIVGEPVEGEMALAERQPSALLQGEHLTDGERDAGLAEPAEHAERPDDATGVVIVTAPAGLPVPLRQRIVRRIGSSPVRTLLPPTLLLLLVGLRDLIVPGAVRGGDLVPFPQGDGLLSRHVAAWHDSGATLSALDPSPAQLVLGLLQWFGGDAGLRVFVLLAPLLAWSAAMRALRPHLPASLPRTMLSIAYASSPPVLAALATGDVVTLVVAVAGPLVVASATSVLDRTAGVERVWRRLAASALTLAVIVAFAPMLIVVLPLIALAGIGHALVAVADDRWRRTLIIRSLLLAALPLPLLGPWLLVLPDVLRLDTTAFGPVIGGHPLLWLALDPTQRLAGAAGAGLVLAAVVGALVVAAATVTTTTFRAVLALTTLALLLPLGAWVLDGLGTALRTGPVLVIAAAAMVALAALGWRHAPEVLPRYAFGWRQIGVASAAGLIVLVTAAGVLNHAVLGTPGLSRTEAVPAFIATLGALPPDRVLVLGATDLGVVWEVVPATGPDLAAFGVRHDPSTYGLIADAVEDLLSGADPRAADRLGRLGIGAVIVPEDFDDGRLDALLRTQAALDPIPTLSGSVSRVSGAIPGAAIVTQGTSTGRVPDPTTPPRQVLQGLRRTSSERFVGDSEVSGDLVVAVPFGVGWQVRVDGANRPMLSDDGLLRVLDVSAGSTVEVSATPSTARRTALRLQAVGALMIVSLGARPPAFAIRNARRRAEAEADA
jgi:GT2 family glycosyltransferase